LAAIQTAVENLLKVVAHDLSQQEQAALLAAFTDDDVGIDSDSSSHQQHLPTAQLRPAQLLVLYGWLRLWCKRSNQEQVGQVLKLMAQLGIAPAAAAATAAAAAAATTTTTAAAAAAETAAVMPAPEAAGTSAAITEACRLAELAAAAEKGGVAQMGLPTAGCEAAADNPLTEPVAAAGEAADAVVAAAADPEAVGSGEGGAAAAAVTTGCFEGAAAPMDVEDLPVLLQTDVANTRASAAELELLSVATVAAPTLPDLETAAGSGAPPAEAVTAAITPV
jgi:hypothetical protein